MSEKSEPQSLENYMAQIARELRALPPQARADELREIEAHLRALIETRGDVAGVLAQFGKPRKIGRELWRAWERKQPEAWWRVVLAPISALGFQALAIYLFVAVSQIDQEYRLDAQLQGIFSHSTVGFIYLLWMVLYFLAFHLVSGFVVGKVSPKRCKWVVAAYFLSVLMLLTSEPIAKAISAYDRSSSDSLSIIWSIMGFHILSTLLYFSGAYFGVHFNRKRDARIANAK